MDGKIFNRSASSVAITNFDFDLQRFDAVEVSDFGSLKTNLEAGNDVKLSGTYSGDATSEITVGGNATLDLNGKTLNLGSNKITVSNGNTFTLNDSGEGGKITGSTSTLVQVGTYVKDYSGTLAKFVMNGGTLSSTADRSNIKNESALKGNNTDGVVQIGQHGTDENEKELSQYSTTRKYFWPTTAASFEMKGGSITSNNTSINIIGSSTAKVTDGTVTNTDGCCVCFGGDSYTAGGGTLEMTGGTLTSNGDSPTIRTTGNQHGNTKINISGGKVIYNGNGTKSKMAIYAAAVGEVNISGTAKIYSSTVGIEIRKGDLNVTGGEIKVGTITKADGEYTVNGKTTGSIKYKPSNSGASCDDGVAVVVCQHDTKKNINVNISGSNTEIEGYAALAVINANGNVGFGESTGPTSKDGHPTGSYDGGMRVGELIDNPDTSLTFPDDYVNYVVGEVKVNVKGGKLISTGTDSVEVKPVTDGTEVKGNNAIVNLDSRATVGLEGSTIVGGVAAITTGRESNTTGYDVGDGNTFSNFTPPEASEGLLTYYTKGDTDYEIAVFGTANWNKAQDSTAENPKWVYFLKQKDSDTTSEVATLSPDNTYNTILKLTVSTADSLAGTPKIDLSNTVLFSGIDDVKTLDVSAGTAKFVLNAIANDKITSILGGAGNDTLTAGAAGTSLNGGAGNDYLIGGDGKDNFIYTAGKDSIEGYTSSDVVSLGAGAGTAPIDFSKLSYDGNDFIVSLGSAEQVLTFINTPEFTIGNVNYKGNSNGIEHIAQGTTGISLGAGYTSKTFDGSSLAYTTIDANAVTTAGGIKITGNDNASSLIGASTGGEIKGGYAGDSLQATGGSTTLNGDYGDDLLKGSDDGAGADTFVYSAGKDSIQNYGESDLVSVKGLNPADAAYSVAESGSNISLDFGGGDLLVFENVIDSGVSLKGSGGNYVYTKYYYAVNDKSVTLAANYSSPVGDGDDTVNTFDARGTNFRTIDAAAVNSAISVIGNSLNNKIFGSKAGGTLNGGDGDDTFDLSERTTTTGGVSYVFQYTAGKDVIDGFVEDNDQLAIEDATKITAAKASGDKLAFTFSSKSDVLTFKADNDIEKVSLNGGGYLTKDGVVRGTSFNLFASAKGTIDLTDTLYKDTGINVVNATAAKNQSVTLVGGTQGGAFTLAENKKKDLFEYGGGDVTISGYEAGKDRINLGNASINGFKVDGDNVSLNVAYGENSQVMSIAGAAGHEVLIHDANSRNNSYAKTVFYANGVLHNKEKRPTIATISTGASGYQADNSIKKIFVTGGVSGISITAGNNKTTLDASEADGVSLYGGNKNDKLIGSTSKADYFFYSAGKDVIENYTADEQISLTGSGLDIEDAKITLSKSSLKFKFSTKNTLTLKDSDLSTIKVDGKNYTFSKNAIGDGNGNVNLTSQFSGTYKIDAEDAGKITAVDGSAVKKNLTFKGTTAAETFTGGQKKTTFKGGGGNDTFIGNETGKDIFFYAKGETGDVTIQKFGFGTNDKLKIASGTISDISTVSGGVQFTMKKSKTDTAKAGTFKVETETTNNPNKVLIKANNTYYWFADSTTAGKTDGVSVGDLITADTKVTKSQANTTGYAILDLGYSTNLTKSTVAVKAGEFTFNNGSISKK